MRTEYLREFGRLLSPLKLHRSRQRVVHRPINAKHPYCCARKRRGLFAHRSESGQPTHRQRGRFPRRRPNAAGRTRRGAGTVPRDGRSRRHSSHRCSISNALVRSQAQRAPIRALCFRRARLPGSHLPAHRQWHGRHRARLRLHAFRLARKGSERPRPGNENMLGLPHEYQHDGVEPFGKQARSFAQRP